MFIDKTKIYVKAGAGGNGAIAFHREKICGGGRPGRRRRRQRRLDRSAGRRQSVHPYGLSLQAQICRPQRHGRPGRPLQGQARRRPDHQGPARYGRARQRDERGHEGHVGFGGLYPLQGRQRRLGQPAFATPTRQVPRFAKAGLPGEGARRSFWSSNCSRTWVWSASRTSENRRFFPSRPTRTRRSQTTILRRSIRTWASSMSPTACRFVMADIPGIIEGAAEGVGLGHDFFCATLTGAGCWSTLWMSREAKDRDPVDDFEKINEELRQYSPDLAADPMIVAANKADLLPPESDNLERLKAHVEAQGYEFYVIPLLRRRAQKELMRTIAGKLANLPPVTVYEPEYVKPLAEAGDEGAPDSAVRRSVGRLRSVDHEADERYQLRRLRVAHVL